MCVFTVVARKYFKLECLEGGQWEETGCEPISCPAPPDVFQGMYTCTNGLYYDSVCTLHCPDAAENVRFQQLIIYVTLQSVWSHAEVGFKSRGVWGLLQTVLSKCKWVLTTLLQTSLTNQIIPESQQWYSHCNSSQGHLDMYVVLQTRWIILGSSSIMVRPALLYNPFYKTVPWVSQTFFNGNHI